MGLILGSVYNLGCRTVRSLPELLLLVAVTVAILLTRLPIIGIIVVAGGFGAAALR